MTNNLPPAHWASDPSGRHEHRYWDGTRWTDHVSDRGAVTVDPIEGAAATTPQDVAAPLPVNGDGLLVPVVEAPPPPPPAAGTAYLPTTDLRFGTPRYWRSVDGLKTALVVVLIGSALTAIAQFFTSINRIVAIDNFQANVTFSNAGRVRDADDAVSGASGFRTVFLIAVFVLFVIWQWRLAKNAEVLGRDGARFSPGWSIGGWFIPFANFAIPVMIVQGLWRASTPGTRPGTEWRDRKGTALVAWWWTAFLLGNFLMISVSGDTTLDDVRNASTATAVGSVVNVIAAVLAILVVVQLTRRFDARRDEVVGRQR